MAFSTFPRFSGNDPDVWISTMERFLFNSHILPHQYVQYALQFLEGEALTWARPRELLFLEYGWYYFVSRLLWEFAKPYKEELDEFSYFRESKDYEFIAETNQFVQGSWYGNGEVATARSDFPGYDISVDNGVSPSQDLSREKLIDMVIAEPLESFRIGEVVTECHVTDVIPPKAAMVLSTQPVNECATSSSEFAGDIVENNSVGNSKINVDTNQCSMVSCDEVGDSVYDEMAVHDINRAEEHIKEQLNVVFQCTKSVLSPIPVTKLDILDMVVEAYSGKTEEEDDDTSITKCNEIEMSTDVQELEKDGIDLDLHQLSYTIHPEKPENLSLLIVSILPNLTSGHHLAQKAAVQLFDPGIICTNNGGSAATLQSWYIWKIQHHVYNWETGFYLSLNCMGVETKVAAIDVSARMSHHRRFVWEPGPFSSDKSEMSQPTELDAGDTSNQYVPKLSVENFCLRSHCCYVLLDSFYDLFYLPGQKLVIQPVLLCTCHSRSIHLQNFCIFHSKELKFNQGYALLLNFQSLSLSAQCKSKTNNTNIVGGHSLLFTRGLLILPRLISGVVDFPISPQEQWLSNYSQSIIVDFEWVFIWVTMFVQSGKEVDCLGKVPWFLEFCGSIYAAVQGVQKCSVLAFFLARNTEVWLSWTSHKCIICYGFNVSALSCVVQRNSCSHRQSDTGTLRCWSLICGTKNLYNIYLHTVTPQNSSVWIVNIYALLTSKAQGLHHLQLKYGWRCSKNSDILSIGIWLYDPGMQMFGLDNNARILSTPNALSASVGSISVGVKIHLYVPSSQFHYFVSFEDMGSATKIQLWWSFQQYRFREINSTSKIHNMVVPMVFLAFVSRLWHTAWQVTIFFKEKTWKALRVYNVINAIQGIPLMVQLYRSEMAKAWTHWLLLYGPAGAIGAIRYYWCFDSGIILTLWCRFKEMHSCYFNRNYESATLFWDVQYLPGFKLTAEQNILGISVLAILYSKEFYSDEETIWCDPCAAILQCRVIVSSKAILQQYFFTGIRESSCYYNHSISLLCMFGNNACSCALQTCCPVQIIQYSSTGAV